MCQHIILITSKCTLVWTLSFLCIFPLSGLTLLTWASEKLIAPRPCAYMWSNWGLKGSSCFIVCHHLELARSGSKECWTTHNAGFGIEQACVCLLRAWVSETQSQFMPLLKFGWWLCLLTTVVWIGSMVALLCGNLASWTPLPRIPSLYVSG